MLGCPPRSAVLNDFKDGLLRVFEDPLSVGFLTIGNDKSGARAFPVGGEVASRTIKPKDKVRNGRCRVWAAARCGNDEGGWRGEQLGAEPICDIALVARSSVRISTRRSGSRASRATTCSARLAAS